MSTDKFDQPAIVELFGRQIIAGHVTEVIIGGQGFMRVDVPATETTQAFTKMFGGAAVYAITPCDEATMLEAVKGLRQKPINIYSLNLPALTGLRPGEGDDNDLEDQDER